MSRERSSFPLAVLCMAGAATSPAWAQTPAPAWTTTISSEVRYYSYHTTQSAKGYQVYAPLGIQLSGRPNPDWKLDFLVRSGALNTQSSTPGASSTASTFTDTNFTPTATYYGWNGVTPYMSVAFNLPTASGSSSTTTTQANSKTDPDITPSPTFGEGFNVGPTLGANINISETIVLGLGGGYTYRGAFDQATTVAVSEFDPGDVYTFNVSLGYRGDKLSVQSSLSYSGESSTEQNGLPIYRAGDRFIGSLKVGYTIDDNWATRASVSYSAFARNGVPAGAGVPALVREVFNSNSNVLKLSLDASYSRDNYSIGPNVGYLYRDRNGYDPTTFQFVPAKTNWSVGVGGNYRFTREFTMTASVQRIWVNEDGDVANLDDLGVPIPGTAIPESSTDAWVASIGGTYKF